MRLDELEEAEVKKVVFTFGRLNPPHFGHHALIQTLQKVAQKQNCDWFLFVSSKTGDEKNPLTYEQKVWWIQALFPETKGHLIVDQKIKTPLVAATWLYNQGYRAATFVAGEDDMASYGEMIKSGNTHGQKNPNAVNAGKGFVFNPLDFAVSPRLASATNARRNVTDGDPEAFVRSILGPKINPNLAKLVQDQLYPTLRKAMGLSESIEESWNVFPTVREIAQKHMTTPDEVHRQINRGVKIEFEKNHDIETATDIAMSNLSKKMDYYTRLATAKNETVENQQSDYEIHNYEKLDGILLTLCELVVQGQKSDPDKYGVVAAGVLDPDNRLVTGINMPTSNGHRRHGERVAIDNYHSKYGEIPKGSIILTTCSPCSEHMDDRYGEDCTQLITDVGVKKVYCGFRDPTQHEEQREFNLIETANKKIRSLCEQFAQQFMDYEAQQANENFADGKGPGRPGDSQRHGIPKGASISQLEKSSHAKGRKGQLARWQLNMRRGKKRANEEVTNEVADQPYRFISPVSTATAQKSMFKTDGGSTIQVFIQVDTENGVADIGFYDATDKDNPTIQMTGKGDAFRIFATVGAIVKQFVDKRKPQYISFSGKASEAGRIKLYDMIAKNIGRYLPEYKLINSGDIMAYGDKGYMFKRVAQKGVVEEKKPKKPKTIIDGALKTLIAKGRSEDEAIADLKKEIDGKFYDLTETREGALNWLKSYLPTWPEYVLRDWLYRGLTAKEHNPPEHPKEVVDRSLAGEGMSAQTQWKLIPNFEFKIEKLHPDTQRRINIRAGGSSNPMNVPKDAERHATQAALAQQQGGVRKEPVIGKMTPQGFELIEGWHRTIQHFKMFPNGYSGPAWVAMNAKTESWSPMDLAIMEGGHLLDEFDENLEETLKKVKGKWALVSRKNPKKVLQYYHGSGHPSKDWVSGVERRVHSFESIMDEGSRNIRFLDGELILASHLRDRIHEPDPNRRVNPQLIGKMLEKARDQLGNKLKSLKDEKFMLRQTSPPMCLGGLAQTRPDGSKLYRINTYRSILNADPTEKVFNLHEDVEDSAKPLVYLDMDGVLADFFGDWSKISGVSHYKDIGNVEQALQLVRDHPTFWIDLPLLPHARALVQTVIEKYGEYRICSTPLAGDERSKPGKIAWIKKHFADMPPAEIVLTHNKAERAQHNGVASILVDDFGTNINKWKAAGGIGIKYEDSAFPKVATILTSIAKSGVPK